MTTTLEICKQFKLGDKAQPLLGDNPEPSKFLQRLADQELWEDAFRFSAFWLPKRQAIWWGCLCLWHVYDPEPPVKDLPAMESAFCWVRNPTEKNRRAAEAAGKGAAGHTPAGCLAQAAFYSGGSISIPGQPTIAPKPFLTGKMVSVAVVIASRKATPTKMATVKRAFVALAFDVVQGKLSWDPDS